MLRSTQYAVLSTQYSVRLFNRRPLTDFPTLPLVLLTLLTFPPSLLTAADFATQLAALAAKCDELGLPEQAAISRSWAIPRHSGRQYLFLPSTSDPSTPKSTAPETARQWHRRFLEIRRDYAATLFSESKQQLENGNAARAYQLLFEILREEEGHTEARRILGYERRGAEWRLPGDERIAASKPAFDHPKLGWRSRQYWALETAHYQLVCNHSAKEIVEAGHELEKLHALWQQIFFRCWSTHAALQARFAGASEPLAPDPRKLRVVLFKNRQEYAAYVASAHPKAASTLGFYDDDQRIVYFFAGDKSVYPTWRHEATHQLFQEYAETQARSASKGNPSSTRDFWALEAIALYMESLAEHAGFWTTGGCESDRLQFARYRVLSGDLDLPLAKLSVLTRDDIQKSEDIGRLYTQAAGLAHYLLDGQEGAYRDAFIEFLIAIYQGRDTQGLLSQLTGQPAEQLDAQYRAYLNVTDADLAAIPSPQNCKNLSLCRTQITDAGLAHFAATKDLKWLDLTLTAATDAGLKNFASNRNLKQLFLEGSKVTEASAPLLATFKQLEELDLDTLPWSEESKKRLRAALPKLK